MRSAPPRSRRGSTRRPAAGRSTRGARTGRRRFFDYPRSTVTGFRRWLPSWRVVLGTFLGLVFVGLGAAVAAYATLKVPSPSAQVAFQTSTVYFANNADGSRGPVMGTFADQKRDIVDYATLTGACVVALGNDVAGLMTNDESWCGAVKSAADKCGEPMWQLPMFPEFGEQIRSEVADIKNVGEGRWGGAITAAKFLEEFVAGKPWVHIDIAGPSFLEGAKPWIDAGGSGFGVRTLVELASRDA